MTFDGETDAQDDDATAAAKAEIFGALDGSTMAEAEADPNEPDEESESAEQSGGDDR